MSLIKSQSQYWIQFIVCYYRFLFNSCLGIRASDEERRKGQSEIRDTQRQQRQATRHSRYSTYSVSVLEPIESLVPTLISQEKNVDISQSAKMTGPVHNSAVYVLGQHPQHAPAIPPPSPPSPVTPSDSSELCAPIEELSLDNDVAPPPSPSPPETPATPRTVAFDGKQSTAPSSVSSPSQLFDDRLLSAVHVLNTEATSLTSLTEFYATDPVARSAFNTAVDIITSRSRGKLVIIGVGKSGHIARKLVATFNSLSIYASFMHPTEALHGDLGHVGPDDTLMLITFSGKTPELSLLMPHLDARLPLIVLTGRTMEAEVVKQRELAAAAVGSGASSRTVLLPAPIHESETVSFGVSAPTTSTTMALAVGDALALTCAQEMNPCAGGVAAVFGRNHPGGAIGATYRKPQSLRDVMVPLDDITTLPAPSAAVATPLVGGDVLRAAYTCKTGWLRIGSADDGAVVPPGRIRRMTSAELSSELSSLPWLAVGRASLISLGAATQLKDAGEWLRANMAVARRPRDLCLAGDGDEDDVCTPESVVAVVDGGEVVGVLEASAILDVTA